MRRSKTFNANWRKRVWRSSHGTPVLKNRVRRELDATPWPAAYQVLAYLKTFGPLPDSAVALKFGAGAIETAIGKHLVIREDNNLDLAERIIKAKSSVSILDGDAGARPSYFISKSNPVGEKAAAAQPIAYFEMDRRNER